MIGDAMDEAAIQKCMTGTISIMQTEGCLVRSEKVEHESVPTSTRHLI